MELAKVGVLFSALQCFSMLQYSVATVHHSVGLPVLLLGFMGRLLLLLLCPFFFAFILFFFFLLGRHSDTLKMTLQGSLVLDWLMAKLVVCMFLVKLLFQKGLNIDSGLAFEVSIGTHLISSWNP